MTHAERRADAFSVIKPGAVRLGVDVLTVGQAAAVCGCAPRTVARWLDAGVLRGYRLPMGKDRRVPAAALASEDEVAPADWTAAGYRHCLIPPVVPEAVVARLGLKGGVA